MAGTTLTIETTVRASGDATVPISVRLPPLLHAAGRRPRRWEIEIPVRERLRLDCQMLPTGEREVGRVTAGPLGSRTFDDAYVAPADSAPFVVAGGGRRIEVAVRRRLPYAQVYAPADDDGGRPRADDRADQTRSSTGRPGPPAGGAGRDLCRDVLDRRHRRRRLRIRMQRRACRARGVDRFRAGGARTTPRGDRPRARGVGAGGGRWGGRRGRSSAPLAGECPLPDRAQRRR